jgi:hypothetical protein
MTNHHPKIHGARALPDGFWRVRLRLAREPGHPQGSRDIGYDLVVPLGRGGEIDAAKWKSHRDRCRFVHLKGDDEHQSGHLVRLPGGSWSFHYDISGDEDDAAGFRFENERFVVGEYVSVREEDGMHTYVVSSVEKL